MSSSSSESDKSDTDHVTQNQLPVISQAKYMKAYDNFIVWRSEKGYNNFSEDLILSYFKDLAKTKQPSTLWSTYSMLKATLHTNNDINIETYYKLSAYLKQLNKGFKSKKSKVFSRSEVETFLKEAPDKDYLVLKVALIIGVQGGCRGGELLNLRIDDIEKHSEQLLLVKLKYKRERSFVIRDEHKDIVEKYIALRPPDAGTDRFFMRYHNGKCFRQVIGKSKISTMPQEIASFLNLSDPKLYTGHCFRRTASTLSGGIQVELPSLRRSERDNSNAARELFIADPHENEAAVEIDTIFNTGPLSTAATPKVEISPSSPTCSASLSPNPSMSEQQDREVTPPPQKKQRIHELQTGRIKITESVNNTYDTKSISVPTKNITIIFENCKNVSNININF